MPLQWNKVEVPMGFGIDEAAHKFVAQPPGMSVLINGRWDKDGQINVREGYDQIAATLGSPERLLKFRDRLLLTYLDPNALTTNNEVLLSALDDDDARLDKQGGTSTPSALCECTIDGRDAISRDQQGSYESSDLAIYEAGKLAVISWIGFRPIGPVRRVYAIVIDTETLATVTPVQEISSGGDVTQGCSGTRIVIEGTTAHVIYGVNQGGHTDLRSKQYDLSAKTWGTDILLAVDAKADTPMVFDACECSSSRWYLIYRNTTPKVAIVQFSGTGVTASTTINEDPIAVAIYAVSSTHDRVWISWDQSGVALRAALLDEALAVTTGPTSLDVTATVTGAIGIVELSNTQAFFTWTLSATSATTRQTTKFRTMTNASVLGTIASRYSIGLASRPVMNGAHIYAICGYQNSITPSGGLQSLGALYTVALSAFSLAATPNGSEFRNCGIWAEGVSGISTPFGIGLGVLLPSLRKHTALLQKYWFPALVTAFVLNAGSTSDGTPRLVLEKGVDVCRMDLGSTDRCHGIEFGPHFYFAGAQPLVFDGVNIIEHGYTYPPEGALGTSSAPGGTHLSAGVYQVALVWEYRLTTGAVMRSQPILVVDTVSSTTQFTVNANDIITITVPPLNLTQKYNAFAAISANNRFVQSVNVVMYRTEANGSIFYRDHTAVNDAFGTSITIVMTAPDVTILGSETLYTTGGGMLPCWGLPALDDVVVYKNRLFGISSEDKKQLVFTQFLTDGEVPMWHPFLVQRIDDDGDCTGLAVMDDNLVVFKRDAIYIMRGNGPDAKGLNSDYIVQRVQSPHGCIERPSIVTDPNGVHFRARLGLMRLNRKMQVEYVGAKIQDFLTDSHTVNCAVALPNYVERIYWLTGDDSNNDRFLIYQWDNDQWAVDIVEGDETAPLVPRSMVWLNGLAYAVFDGDVNLYAHRGEDDPNDVITFAFATQWLKFAGQEGFKRIRAIELLGEFHRDHDLTIYLFRDYDDQTPFQTITFDDTVLSTLKPYQLKLHVSEQRMESLTMYVLVTPQVSDSFHSRCVTFVGMAFDVGIKPTMMRLPAAHQSG